MFLAAPLTLQAFPVAVHCPSPKSDPGHSFCSADSAPAPHLLRDPATVQDPLDLTQLVVFRAGKSNRLDKLLRCGGCDPVQPEPPIKVAALGVAAGGILSIHDVATVCQTC